MSWECDCTCNVLVAAVIALVMLGGMDERRLRCLYVGEPSMTEYTLEEGKLLEAVE